MKRVVFSSGVLGVAALFASCAKDTITSWDSPRMHAAKEEWNLLLDTPSSTWGAKNEKLIERQEKLLRETLSRTDMRNLAATCGTLPMHESDPNAFEAGVLEYIVASFIKDGDRESLVTLLSTRFQERVGPETPTVSYLLFCPNRALKDPIMVLGEAYARSKEPDVRSKIAATTRIAFRGFSIPGKDDAEYVANAMQWYEENKIHLKPRGVYSARHPGTLFADDREIDSERGTH